MSGVGDGPAGTTGGALGAGCQACDRSTALARLRELRRALPGQSPPTYQTSKKLSRRCAVPRAMAQSGTGALPAESLSEQHSFELEMKRECNRAQQLRRWDQMHIALAALVIAVVTFLVGVFALRGDVQGMSSAAAIGSGWVGAVLGWFFTRSATAASGGQTSTPAGAKTPPPQGAAPSNVPAPPANAPAPPANAPAPPANVPAPPANVPAPPATIAAPPATVPAPTATAPGPPTNP